MQSETIQLRDGSTPSRNESNKTGLKHNNCSFPLLVWYSGKQPLWQLLQCVCRCWQMEAESALLLTALITHTRSLFLTPFTPNQIRVKDVLQSTSLCFLQRHPVNAKLKDIFIPVFLEILLISKGNWFHPLRQLLWLGMLCLKLSVKLVLRASSEDQSCVWAGTPCLLARVSGAVWHVVGITESSVLINTV